MRKIFVFAFLFTFILSLLFVKQVSAQIPPVPQIPTNLIPANNASAQPPTNQSNPAPTATPTSSPLKEGNSCDPGDKGDPYLGCPAGTTCASLDTSSSDTTCIKDSVLSQIENERMHASLPCSQWVNLSGTPVPASEIKGKKDIKCASVNTAIGNISTDPAGFVKSIFSIVLGLSGGIALILIIISGYSFMTSQGNPEKVKAATERLTSAIIGLLFIIFAFVILQIVGVDILRIPGFTK